MWGLRGGVTLVFCMVVVPGNDSTGSTWVSIWYLQRVRGEVVGGGMKGGYLCCRARQSREGCNGGACASLEVYTLHPLQQCTQAAHSSAYHHHCCRPPLHPSFNPPSGRL